MNKSWTKTLNLASADETADLARRFAQHIMPADIMLLSGEIGAGKTHFARSLIHALQEPFGTPEEVPSPTFTRVQTYPVGKAEIWHADLYRLGSVDEIAELGLFDAFLNTICLVEWPERLGKTTPERHLALRFQQGKTDDARLLDITANGGGWDWLNDV